jgi:transposase
MFIPNCAVEKLFMLVSKTKSIRYNIKPHCFAVKFLTNTFLVEPCNGYKLRYFHHPTAKSGFIVDKRRIWLHTFDYAYINP